MILPDKCYPEKATLLGMTIHCELPRTPHCPRFLAYARPRSLPLNVFLVMLNNQIKFRRYKRMSDLQALPQDVQEFIDLIIELADLIYWVPVIPSHSYHFAEGAMQDVQDIDMGIKTRILIEVFRTSWCGHASWRQSIFERTNGIWMVRSW